MSNYPDLLDRASELAGRYADEGVAHIQKQAAPQQVQREDGSWPYPECIECGEDIPEARLKLGRIRCVGCQEAFEKHRNQFGYR